MEHITDFFNYLLRQYGSVDIAEAELKRQINEDADLHRRYREWCDENGSSEKRGFLDYCEEYLESQESVWDNLRDEYENE